MDPEEDWPHGEPRGDKTNRIAYHYGNGEKVEASTSRKWALSQKEKGKGVNTSSSAT